MMRLELAACCRMGTVRAYSVERTSACPPYPEQESEKLGDGVIARLNPDTEDIESLEILSFSTRLKETSFELPITAALRRAG